MATAIVMPRQGQSVESCIITKWYKSKGETVKEGEMLFSYETDKAAFDQEAPESGILLDIFFAEGDEVPVLKTVAVIGETGEDYNSLISDHTLPEASSGKETPIEEKEVTAGFMDQQLVENQMAVNQGIDSDEQKVRVSPLARKLAREHNIALENLKGTGPKGRIIERDIRSAAGSTSLGDASKEGPDFTMQRLSNVRMIIARKMHQSLQNSAQLTHHMSADARKLLAWRKEIKAGKKADGYADVTINDMVCFAVIKALKKHSLMNAHFSGNEIKIFHKVHLGVAVDTERGLMVPVIRDAGDMNIGQLSVKLKDVADSCRKGNIDPELLNSESASFTVTNLGAYGVEMFTPVLNLPQVGIMGINAITYRPADMGDGIIGFIPVIGLSLTYDHRAIDGAPASVFLAEVRNEIENIK